MEETRFELNIRAVSGGQGLIRDGQAVVNLTPTSTTGRDADLDAIAAYIVFGIKAPDLATAAEDVSSGERSSRAQTVSNVTAVRIGRAAAWTSLRRRMQAKSPGGSWCASSRT
jgi:hypothetical protein